MSGLPAADWQSPACGACGSETDHDGDGFVCYPCGLVFDQAAELAASFLDEDAQPCGTACDNYWHGDDKIEPGARYECAPCTLPAGHESMHFHPCDRLVRREAVEGA